MNMRYVHTIASKGYVVRVPGAVSRSFPVDGLEKALAHRDAVARRLELDMSSPFRKHFDSNRTDKSHPWLPPGISLRKGKRPNGADSFIAADARTGEGVGRSFGGRLAKRTRREALLQVIEWRKERGYYPPADWEYPFDD